MSDLKQNNWCGKRFGTAFFRSVDEIIAEGVQARRRKHQSKQLDSEQRRRAVEQALAFAKNKAIPLGGVSIKELIHEGHRF